MRNREHSEGVGTRRDGGGRVEHETYEAIQYDFYIPENIWTHRAVQRFIDRLQSVEQGATVMSRLSGVWQGEPEQTGIFRIIVPASRSDAAEGRAALHQEIERLMDELAGDAASAQEAFMFTETAVRASVSRRVVRGR